MAALDEEYQWRRRSDALPLEVPMPLGKKIRAFFGGSS
jgi:hypothetical protein